MTKLKVLSVFDFDGTLTYHNSFILFLSFAFGKLCFTSCLTRMVLPLLNCVYYKLSRDEIKRILIKAFLTDVNENWLHQQAKLFCDKYWIKLMRPAGILSVKKEINSGAEVTICSASPELILKPFADKLGIKLISTQLEVNNGKMTGRITGHNCRCAQKIIRLKNIYGDLGSYYLRAWGDTSGDYELLAAAQEPHWRHFS